MTRLKLKLSQDIERVCLVVKKPGLGGSLEIKMADDGTQSSIFILKHNGSIDFSINQKTTMQEFRFFHVWSLSP